MAEHHSRDRALVRRGMRWKMMVAMAGMIVAIVAMLTILSIGGQKAGLEKHLETHSAFLKGQMNRNADRLSGRMSEHFEKLIATRRLPLAGGYVREMVRDIDDLRYVILMQEGEPRLAHGSDLSSELRRDILAGAPAKFAASRVELTRNEFEAAGLAFLETIEPVHVNGQQWGVLRLGFSLHELNNTLLESRLYMDQEARNMVIQATLTALLFLLLGGIVIYYLAGRWINPIQKLVDFSHKLADGDFNATPHVSTRSNDEIGLLVSALEEMADSLCAAHKQQEAYSHTLEETVAKRTRDLESARDRAIGADKSKSEFLANMSHEIRTPINAVIGLTHLALDRERDAQQKDYLCKTMEASEALLAVINDVLDFSKIEANKLEMDCIDFGMDEVMHNLASIGGVRASEKGLDFLIDVPPDMPCLRGDPYRLGQVLLNLVNNAVKFTDSGQVIVAARVLEEEGDALTLRFTVTDSGIGLNEEQQRKLFSAFTQADSSITRNYGGTGLGLAISKQLVEMMQGEIGLDSIAGKGSCFHFTARFKHGEAPKSERFEMPPELDQMRVLIVDDNPTSKIIIARYAESFGFRPAMASTVAEAAAALVDAADDPFGLLVLDWTLAEMSGLESLAMIRKAAGLRRMPAAFLTANFGQKISQDDLLAAGFDALLQKPLTLASIVKTARDVLGQSEDGDAEAATERWLPVEMIAHLKGARLLLVEDNEINQMVAEGLLMKAGISLAIAHNGQQAVDAVADDVFDGVLMDMQMPVMDGLEATRLIRQHFSSEKLPIIAMTANAMAQDVEACLEAGMNDHIAKPVDPRDLYSKLDKWISHSRIGYFETGVVELAEEGGVENIPAMSGIDIEQGLQRVGGDQALYRKILAKFIDNQAGAISQARDRLESSDREAGQMLLHSLKGVAGNIGAADLYRVAAQLEQAVRAGQTPSDDEFTGANEMLLDIVDAIQTGLESSATVQLAELQDLVAASELLARMRALLEDHNGDAVDLMDELSAALGSAETVEQLAVLKTQLDGYDFEAALAELATIEDTLSARTLE